MRKLCFLLVLFISIKVTAQQSMIEKITFLAGVAERNIYLDTIKVFERGAKVITMGGTVYATNYNILPEVRAYITNGDRRIGEGDKYNTTLFTDKDITIINQKMDAYKQELQNSLGNNWKVATKENEYTFTKSGISPSGFTTFTIGITLKKLIQKDGNISIDVIVFSNTKRKK
jgi:hypothetical protein